MIQKRNRSAFFAAVCSGFLATGCGWPHPSWVLARGAESPGPGAAPRPGRTVRALVLEQEAVGLPDERSDRPVRQRLVIDVERSRVVLSTFPPSPQEGAPEGAPRGAPREGGDPAGPAPDAAPLPAEEGSRKIILLLDRDPAEIYEVHDQSRSFSRSQGDLNKLQEERNKEEDQWLRHLRSMSRAEQKKVLEENHLQPRRKRDVVVERRKGRTITLDKISYECEEVRVLENGRAVIHAQLASDAAGGGNFFELYRRLGAFSKEVLDKVKDLGGVPLEAEITVVTAAPVFKIKARALSLKREELPESTFEVPAGYTERKVEDSPFARCPICGKEFEKDLAKGRVRDKKLYFDTAECMEKWIRQSQGK